MLVECCAQAYAYASGRPLVLADPLGLMPGDEFGDIHEAAFDALQYASGLSATSDYAVTYGAKNQFSSTQQREYGGCVCDRCGSYYATKFVESAGAPGGRAMPVATASYLAEYLCGPDPVVAEFHSHPYSWDPSNPEDFNNIGARGRRFGHTMGPDGTFAIYDRSSILSVTPYAGNVGAFANMFRSGALSRQSFIAVPGF